MVISIEYFIAHCLFAENINRNRNSFGFRSLPFAQSNEKHKRIRESTFAQPTLYPFDDPAFETKSIKSIYGMDVWYTRCCSVTEPNTNTKIRIPRKKINKNNAESIVQNPQKECSACIFCELRLPFSHALQSRVRVGCEPHFPCINCDSIIEFGQN